MELSKIDIASGGNVALKVLLQESDGFKGLLAVLDGTDEELVAQTLIVLKGFSLAGDFLTTGLVPSKVNLGLLKLSLEVLASSNSFVVQLLVQSLHLSELSDGGLTNLFVSSVLLVSSILSLFV